MKNEEMQKLEDVLRTRFEHVDIRSDQCDTIRLLSSTLAAGCRYVDGVCNAKVISLTANELDYGDELVAEFQESSPEALADRLAEYY